MEGSPMELVTLEDLLYEGEVTIGTLATAIEQNGIWGWDRYGRFRHFSHDSDEGKTALDLLAAQSSYMGDPEQEVSPLDDGALQTISPYATFGWKENEEPDFEAIKSGDPEPPSPRPQAASKSANAYLVVIGVLLEYIKGETKGISRHPDFKDEGKMHQVFKACDPKVPGLKDRTLQTKFAKAKQALAMQRAAY